MSDNPKLRNWQGYSLTSLPSNYAIPEGRFLLPVCTDARRLGLMLQALAEWKQYDEFPEKYIYDHMIDVLEALAYINDPTGAACEPLPNDGCEDGCTTYPARSGIIRFAPNDPFRTPNLNVGGYGNPPWRTYSDILGIPSTLVGLQAGDALVTTDSLPSGLGGLLPIPNPLDLPDLIAAGFPRFKVKFSGSGMVELHLLSVPVGGVALVTVDGQINELTRWVELSTFNLSSLGTLDDLIEAVMGIVTPQELAAVSETIIEIPIDNAGDHYIDVTFLPRIALDDFGFGGGLRKVVFCGDDMEVEEPMLQLRIEDCELRLYSVIGEGESAVETLISGVDLNECQAQLTASAQATTLAPNEPATASVQVVDNDFQFEFGIPKGEKGDNAPIPEFHFSQPTDNIIYLQIDTDGSGGYDVQSPNLKGAAGEDGQGIDSVEVTTLEAGATATVNLVDGVLQLGIPRGENGEDGENLTPITSVEVTTLAAGASATASLVGGVLQLGIPRGNTGLQGPQGLQGLQGIQGIPGQDGDDCDCESPVADPPPSITNENICSGANGVVQWLLAAFSNFIADTQTKIDAGLVPFQLAGIFAGPLDDVVSYDMVLDLVGQLTGVTSSLILNDVSDPDFPEALACDLYCRVKNSDPQGISDAIVNAWINEIPDNFGGIALKAYLYGTVGSSDGIGETRRRIRNRFNIYARNTDSTCEALCTDCPDEEPDGWEHQITGFDNFDTITYGFESGHSYISGCQPATWVGSNYVRPIVQLTLIPDMPEGSAITGLRVEIIGNETTLKQIFIYNQYAALLIASEDNTNYTGDHIYDFNFPEMPQQGLYWFVAGNPISAVGCTQQFVVDKVIIRGTGPNPFA